MQNKIFLIFKILLIFFISTSLGYSDFKVFTKNKDIYFQNSFNITNIKPFVVWFDLDNNSFFSLHNKKWENGIKPLVDTKMTCPKFNGKISLLPANCPENHRCFIGVALVYDNGSYDLSIYPLSEKAVFERLVGQNYFITNNINDSKDIEQPVSVDEKNKTITDSGVEIEKPDFYKFDNENNFLFYANTKAQLFEVIDISKPEFPKLIDNYTFTGEPKEIYKIGDNYVILLEKDNQTILNSFKFKENSLILSDNLTLSGRFIESRRRNNLIYILSKLTYNQVCFYAVQIEDNGGINNLDDKVYNDFPDLVAIFNDYMVLGFKTYSDNDNFENLKIIPINNPLTPIAEEYSIKIKGYIPSDKHLFFKENYFMFVVSPFWQDFSKGSSFYVYKIDNNTVRMENKVDKIAPSEQLYATVFTNNRAYVVTFKRKDPLWVIDISNPEFPEIIGKLSIPGWSEKLFFNNNSLLSLGYLDRLISIGLFDVSVPEKPVLVSRLTPLLNQIKYSYSEAISDERAFYISWDDNVSTLPIDTWYKDNYHFVQAIGISKNSLTDLGIASLSFKASRSFWIKNKYIVVFSSREMVVFQEENKKLIEKSRMPLSFAVDKVGIYNNNIAAISRLDYIYRFYLLDNKLNKQQEYSIKDTYRNVVFDKKGDRILFYNLNPLKFMIFKNGNFLKKEIESNYEKLDNYYRLSPFLSRENIILPIFYYRMNSPYFKNQFSSYAVEIFNIEDSNDSKIFPTPGKAVGVDIYGNLITYEPGNNKDSLRINLLKVDELGVSLLDSQEINNCNYSSAEVFVGKRKIFINCKEVNFQILKTANESLPEYNSKNKIVIFKTGQKLIQIKNINLNQQIRIIKVDEDSDLMLTTSENYYYAYMPIWYNRECELYNFSEDFKLIKKIKNENCMNSENVLFYNKKVIIGNKEKGVKVYNIK